MPSAASDEQLVAMLVDRARSEDLQLTGEGGLLQMLTKRVLESARTIGSAQGHSGVSGSTSVMSRIRSAGLPLPRERCCVTSMGPARNPRWASQFRSHRLI
jgi:hypothetical protein